MSRSFLTGLNLNKNELLNARIQNLATAPSSPVLGQIYFDTDTNQINVWDGTAWAALAAGGNVGDQIQAAIDAITTDDIEEGSTNLYYSTAAAQTDAASLLTGATLTNITITGNGSGLTITAENGVADSTTDDLTEGSTNLYFATGRVDSHLTGGDGISYSSGTISVDLTTSGGLAVDVPGQLKIDRTTVDAWYDAAGAASDVAGDLSTHESDTSAHGVTGDVVGTSDSQTLTNKTFGDTIYLGSGGPSSEIGDTSGNLTVKAWNDLTLSSYSGDVILSPQSGSVKLGVDLDADTHKITNLVDPTSDQDAATKIYVDTAVSNLVDSAPSTLDTLNELAAALGDDASFSTTIATSIGEKVAKAGDTMTGDLVLAGAPTLDLHAATKKYVDDEISGAITATKYAVNNTLLEPTSNVVTWTVTHNLGTRDVVVQVYTVSGYNQVEVDVVRTSTSVVTLSWVASANVTADTYRVVVAS